MRALRSIMVTMLTGVLVLTMGSGVAAAGGRQEPPSSLELSSVLLLIAIALVVFVVTIVSLRRSSAPESETNPKRESEHRRASRDDSPEIPSDLPRVTEGVVRRS